jgi:hypothetical protein
VATPLIKYGKESRIQNSNIRKRLFFAFLIEWKQTHLEGNCIAINLSNDHSTMMRLEYVFAEDSI